jgi:hypothetical protein
VTLTGLGQALSESLNATADRVVYGFARVGTTKPNLFSARVFRGHSRHGCNVRSFEKWSESEAFDGDLALWRS